MKNNIGNLLVTLLIFAGIIFLASKAWHAGA